MEESTPIQVQPPLGWGGWLRRIVLVALALIIAIVVGIGGVSGYVGWTLTHPDRKELTGSPLDVGLTYKNVAFASRGDHLQIQGWLMQAEPNLGTVIFAHGFRANRMQDPIPVLSRILVDRGYNVLMFDFRNSGLSEGELTSVGQYEVNDLLGAVDYIQQQADLNQEIILMGYSMGAATSILAGSREPDVAAVVADSAYADLSSYLLEDQTVWTQLPPVPFNRTLPLMLPVVTGVEPDKVSPVEEIKNMKGRPVLLIHGTDDCYVPVINSQRLKNAYPEAQLLHVTEADHCQSFNTNQQLYLQTLFNFLDQLSDNTAAEADGPTM